jgi:hypothetical protein
LTRLTLTPTASARFPDIGNRLGTKVRRSGDWVVVKWDSIDGETWLPAASVEAVQTEGTT